MSQYFSSKSFTSLVAVIFYICGVSKFAQIYRRNIYGVMGTLVFHILVFASFLLADVNMKGRPQEEVLLVEFPDLPSEPEMPEEESMEQSQEQQTQSSQVDNLTNIASNRTARENTTTSAEDFFDDDYLKEVEDARQLSNSVSNNLSKETVDLSDIKMPVETSEEMTRDSAKNVIYAGDSNIEIYLDNRICVSLPVPVYLAQGGGKVIVDISVNQNGRVTEASARKNSSIGDEQIFLYAQEAASRTLFNPNPSAPRIQKGTIHYTFVAQ